MRTSFPWGVNLFMKSVFCPHFLSFQSKLISEFRHHTVKLRKLTKVRLTFLEKRHECFFGFWAVKHLAELF